MDCNCGSQTLMDCLCPDTCDVCDRKLHTCECPDEDLTPNKTELWDADPDCKHVIRPASGGGIKCQRCAGWFCY